jgi:dihydrofolate synthase/folylpolyglutamate synthase
MAFLQFQRRRVDVAVIETGMGGRLDATNVVQPEVSVITSIGLDHCAELGGTVEQIAREKAGIIKPRRPVVIGRMPGGAERVIREVAVTQEAPVHSVRELFGEELSAYPVTNLEGDYQRWNAATATLAVRLFGESRKAAGKGPPANLSAVGGSAGSAGPAVDVLSPITETMLAAGLTHVDWPGRWQRLAVGGRALILDASHNPEGAAVLEKNLLKLISVTRRKPIIVAGALGEFRARALLEVVLRHAREVSLVTPHQARATPYAEMIGLVPPAQRSLVREDSLDRIFPDAATCALGAPGDTVVVTGSIYLLGEVLERLQPAVGAREGKLQDF